MIPNAPARTFLVHRAMPIVQFTARIFLAVKPAQFEKEDLTNPTRFSTQPLGSIRPAQFDPDAHLQRGASRSDSIPSASPFLRHFMAIVFGRSS